MCIAIYKPANKELSDSTLKTCFDSNPDGAGFCYINTDNLGVKRMIIKKTMEFDTFLRQYKRAVSIAPESPFLIHFRIRTHGETTTFNCHPFRIDNEHAFIHNGIIRKVSADSRKSDTQMFNEEVLQNLPKGWMFNEAIISLMEDFIDFSKLVIMNIEGQVTLVNESKGTWDQGIWFSNTSYKPRVTYTYTHDRTYGYTPPSYNKATDLIGGARVYTKNSMVKCDGCAKKYQTLESMHIYYQVGTCSVFCEGCAKKLNVSAGGDAGFGDKINVDCYLSYLGEETKKEFDNNGTLFVTWNNPWTSRTALTQDEDEYYDSLSRARSAMI